MTGRRGSMVKFTESKRISAQQNSNDTGHCTEKEGKFILSNMQTLKSTKPLNAKKATGCINSRYIPLTHKFNKSSITAGIQRDIILFPHEMAEVRQTRV